MLHYEGEFKDDLRDGKGVLTLDSENGQVLRYEGEYKDDKRNGKVEEMVAYRDTDHAKVTFKGSLNENEHMSGMGVLETPEVRYTGDFQVNQFNGEGKLEYTESGAVFKGKFAFHQKSGPATFKLKDGKTYSGVFNSNVAMQSKDNFGSRS